jgi:hypothetical protein
MSEIDRLRKANERLVTTLGHVINRVSTEGRDDEHGHIFATGKAALEWAERDLLDPDAYNARQA